MGMIRLVRPFREATREPRTVPAPLHNNTPNNTAKKITPYQPEYQPRGFPLQGAIPGIGDAIPTCGLLWWATYISTLFAERVNGGPLNVIGNRGHPCRYFSIESWLVHTLGIQRAPGR